LAEGWPILIGLFSRLLGGDIEILNWDSALCFAKAALICGTFDFSPTAASPAEEARAVPFCEGSQESMQRTGNEEHTGGSGLTCPLKSEVRVSNP